MDNQLESKKQYDLELEFNLYVYSFLFCALFNDMKKKMLLMQQKNILLNEIFRAATVQIPKPPPQKTLKALEERALGRKRKVAEVGITVYRDI